MLCIWWDWKGVLYYELLPENQMMNYNKYYFQLDQLKAALNEKLPELVNRKFINFHQNNARQQASLMTWQKLSQLGWKILIHLPYSPDTTHADVHLVWSLFSSVSVQFSSFAQLCPTPSGKKNLNSLEDCKRHLKQFFAQQDKKFCEGGIVKLPEKWQNVEERNSEYIV